MYRDLADSALAKGLMRGLNRYPNPSFRDFYPALPNLGY